MPTLALAAAGLAAALLGYVAVGWFALALHRPVLWLVAHSLYRFRAYHRDRIPATGPALIVANHVTYLDWLLLCVASPRPLRFVIWTGFYANPALRLLLSFGRHNTIRVDNAAGRAHAVRDGLARVSAALDAGAVVVIFPEQTLTRNGHMMPFGRGVELILRRCRADVAVIPTCLDNLWGTLFSWSGGRVFGKWPEGPFRRHVAVYFGRPVPATATAAQLRAAVVEANAECGVAQSDYLLPAPRRFVRQAARFRYLFRVACVDGATGTERTLTWAKALVGAWSLARWLRGRVGAEQNVGIWCPTTAGCMLTNVALSFLGKTSVNLNYTAGEGAVLSALGQANVKTVVTSRRFLARVPFEAPPGVTVVYLEDAMLGISARAKLLRFVAVVLLPGWFLDRAVLGLGRLRLDDVCTILFSSGSTGEPKGVMLSHRNIAANVDGFRRGVEFNDADRFLVTLPFFHSFGYTVSMWTTLVVAMEAVYFPDPRSGKELGEMCKRHRCTILVGTATFLRFYLRRSAADDFRSLRLLVCGAEKLPVQLAEEFHARFGVLPYEGYGCTELSPVVSVNIPDVTVGGVTQRANAFGTVGQPIPNVCVKAFDPETLEPLPHGEEGLLGGLGANVMHGYLNQPEQTARALRGGWYISGDVGRVEDDGFIRITGRVSRFAKIAGEMVPLERLDEELHELLSACGERRLAVAAAPDARRGERVVVFHLPEIAGRLPELFERLRKSGLPNLWIPDHRDCHAVEAFPILGTGKLDLKRLGEWARAVAAGQAVPL